MNDRRIFLSKIRSIILVIQVCIAIMISPNITFADGGNMSGSGTAADPFLVADYADLKVVGTTTTYSLSSLYRLVADIDASSSVTENNDSGFVPIGTVTNHFTGAFHGGGYIIKDLTINRPGIGRVGLFCYIDSGSVVDSLGLYGGIVSGGNNVGGLVGINNRGTITCCFDSIIVTGTSGNVGGLIGMNSNGVITECYVIGSITETGSSTNVGGFIGWNSGQISKCYSTASVVTNGHWAGGFIGCNSGTISRCHATGSVNGSGYNEIGGLVGANRGGNIIKSYATGTVSGKNWIGGLIGSTSSNDTISQNYATGSVNGSGSYAGGLVGYNQGYVSLSYSSGQVKGNTYIGGLFGFNSDTVNDCYTISSLTGNVGVGGIVGYLQSGNISSVYWDTQTSGAATAVAVIGSGTIIDTGLTTASMKHASSFSEWNFNSVWTIRADSTYPGLRDIDNAPFAFADTVVSGRTHQLSQLLSNDYDVETIQDNLVLKIISASAGTTDSVSTLMFPDSISNGSIDTIQYRVGEIRSTIGDTLWGNVTTSLVTLDTTLTGVETAETLPTSFELAQNYPNPFNPTTNFQFSIANCQLTILKVYDVLGREVATLVNDVKQPGTYSVRWDGSKQASGVYFYRLTAGSYSEVKKLVLMK